MPVTLEQLPAMPQVHDKAQSSLKHTQGRGADIIDQLVLPAGYSICPPQQQPRIDQRERQQQARQTVSMTQAGEFQAKAAAGVFEILKHFLNPEAFLVA